MKVTVTTNQGAPGVTMRVSRPNSALPCYSIEFGGLPGNTAGIVFKDGAGTKLAEGVVMENGSVSLSCETGSTVVMDKTCIPPAIPTSCSPGVCAP